MLSKLKRLGKYFKTSYDTLTGKIRVLDRDDDHIYIPLNKRLFKFSIFYRELDGETFKNDIGLAAIFAENKKDVLKLIERDELPHCQYNSLLIPLQEVEPSDFKDCLERSWIVLEI